MFLFVLDAVVMDCGSSFFFFQAEDGIRDLVRSRGLGDVYKRQAGLGRGVLQHQSRQLLHHSESRRTDGDRQRLGRALSLIHI